MSSLAANKSGEKNDENDDSTRTIPLDSMSLEELNQVKQQEEARLQLLSSRFAQLRQAAARLSQSSKAVGQLTAASERTAAPDEGVEIMVPLTESVYVPGRMVDADNLLVELGTGYFAEKSATETLAFLDRKKKLVDANSDNVTKAIQATKQNVQALNGAMQGKLLEIRARQEGVRHRAAVEG